MALPASGAISMSQVNTELGLSATAQRSLGDSNVRTLAGVASGGISMSNLHGKSNAPQSVFTTPGTYSWTCPPGVTSVSVVCVAGGAGGGHGIGGGGGALAYKNNISVTPGNSYSVVVGVGGLGGTGGANGGVSSFGTSLVNAVGGYGAAGSGSGGFVSSGTGGAGGSCTYYSGGGGGAGGYSGNGGNGGAISPNPDGVTGTGGAGGGGKGGPYLSQGSGGGGGGVGIYGQGEGGFGGTATSQPGAGGSGGYGGVSGGGPGVSGGNGGIYGGGGGGVNNGGPSIGGNGGSGAVRIIWRDRSSFPYCAAVTLPTINYIANVYSMFTTTVNIPAVTVGDMAFMWMTSNSSTVVPELPSGWTRAATAGGSGNPIYVLNYKRISATASASTLSVANASETMCFVYRGISSVGSTSVVCPGNTQTVLSVSGNQQIVGDGSSRWLTVIYAAGGDITGYTSMTQRAIGQQRMAVYDKPIDGMLSFYESGLSQPNGRYCTMTVELMSG